MTGVNGQTSVEYAGLLAVAAVLGAGLALVAGPPLLYAVRSALVAVLSGQTHSPAPVDASAADIADVESALVPSADALTPDAALLALGRRHRSGRAEEVADALLLDAARRAAPWLGRPRAYRAWTSLEGGPYTLADDPAGDRDQESPAGPPFVTWVTVAAQRRALAAAFAHHTSATRIAVDVIGMIPGARLVREAAAAGASRVARFAVERLPQAVDTAHKGLSVIELVEGEDSDGDVPAGMRAGDVVVGWPVHRTFRRGAHAAQAPRAGLARGLGAHPPVRDYWHLVYLRPGASGLEILAEGVAT
jgi:hypothetical protein